MFPEYWYKISAGSTLFVCERLQWVTQAYVHYIFDDIYLEKGKQ